MSTIYDIIIIGGGQFTQKIDDPLKALPPMGVAAEAATRRRVGARRSADVRVGRAVA